MLCPVCDHENPSVAKFCVACSSPMAPRCPACGSDVPAAAKFCPECAAPVAGRSQVAPQPAAPSEPPLPAASVGERRQLTVLFCDLVGSTALSTHLDAEDYGEAIGACHASAAQVVTRFGGHVAQLLGDGLLVYFGYPHAHEDSAEQAVRAALDVVGAVNALGRGLIVRVGLHSGPCVVSEVGMEGRRETMALGETLNIAARVQAAAAPGTVLISAATHRLVAGRFVVEAAGAHTLKGLAEPMMLYRIVQPSGGRSRFDVARRLTRFVGREVELARLLERWEHAEDGEGQNVVVIGEAGVGKSRLVYQLRERLSSVPHTWLESGATPYTAGTPFQPVVALLAQGLAFAPGDTVDEKLAKVGRGLGERATVETVALLANLLALPPPTVLQLSPSCSAARRSSSWCSGRSP
jgi:class 3 adenylate cyclase